MIFADLISFLRSRTIIRSTISHSTSAS